MHESTDRTDNIRRYTVSDVAKVAQVSESTVSRVINNKNWVKEETRKKVLNAIESLNYQPNLMAQKTGGGLQTNDIIGILLGEQTSIHESQTYFEIMRGVAEVLDEHSRSLLFQHASMAPKSAEPRIPMISRGLVDGVILLGPPFPDWTIRKVKSSRTPHVLIGRHPDVETHRVLVDNIGGGYQATTYLFNENCKNVAIILGDSSVYAFADKLNGFLQAHRDFAEGSTPIVCERQGSLKDAGYEAANALFTSEDPPDGLFVSDALMTAGALGAMNDLGIQVGHDVKVVSYCRGTFAALLNEQIAYVSIGETHIGHAAARLILDLVNRRVTGPLDITISTELVVPRSEKKSTL